MNKRKSKMIRLCNSIKTTNEYDLEFIDEIRIEVIQKETISRYTKST